MGGKHRSRNPILVEFDRCPDVVFLASAVENGIMNFENRFLIGVAVVWLFSLALTFYPTPGTPQPPVGMNVPVATFFTIFAVVTYFVAKKLLALSRRAVARVKN